MIVIPMAGRSQRFRDAGYRQAKFRLPLAGGTVFSHVLESFRAEFDRTPFLFIAAQPDVIFVQQEVRRFGIARFRVVGLDKPTAGQAETVELGTARLAPHTPLTIFNIDTFRPGFQFPEGVFEMAAGWLEVFRGEGSNWSYVKPLPGPQPWVQATAEKRPISDLCCTGLYHFARAGDFRDALAAERVAPQAAELYVAPLYNHLIARGFRVAYRLIDPGQVVFCGTPQEYEALAG